MIHFNPAEFCYIRVPKTASTTFVRGFRKWGVKNKKEGDFKENHTRAYKAKERLPEWDDIWTFGLIRNPWAWYVSYYNYSSRQGNQVDPLGHPIGNGFKTWLHDASTVSPMTWLTEHTSDRLLVDDVFRTEDIPNLGQKFDSFFPEFEMDVRLNPTPSVDYRDFYDDSTRQLVSSRCQHEIEVGKYSF